MKKLLNGFLLLLGIGAVVALAASPKESDPDQSNPIQDSPKKKKHNPQPYSVSLKKYGHIKDLKDYPEKIRWYEPDGEYDNRTFEKWDSKEEKWIEIDSVEFDYYRVSANENTHHKYKRKKETENGKRVFYLQKISI